MCFLTLDAANMLKFKLIKENGNITNQEQVIKQFQEYLPKLKNWMHVIEIKAFRKTRSLNQNRFFHWPFLTHLADILWCDTITAKDEAKRMHLSVPYTWLDQHTHWKVLSTANLTTIEFEAFIDRLRLWIDEDYRVTLIKPSQTEFNYEI